MTAGTQGASAANRMLGKLFELWRLSPAQQVTLLGEAAEIPSADRVAHLLGIHERLRVLFPQNDNLGYSWMTAPNRAFDGRTPVEVVERHGIEGLVAVTAYLDSALQR